MPGCFEVIVIRVNTTTLATFSVVKKGTSVQKRFLMDALKICSKDDNCPSTVNCLSCSCQD